ncbi:GNAT family N-acetyltransferase [Photobacterium nomapromontoriensis]|uniref:GNAT family N-acetyltransferase n=1 Tax=Photobacterium nomapromontoriensis TaxID=2910237 RepID=UPI003D0B48B0
MIDMKDSVMLNPSNLTIRSYQASDLDALMVVWESAARFAHHFLAESIFEQERHNIPNLYLPCTDTWVAVVDQQVVGFLALVGNHVSGLFVAPELHGQGIGLALMNKAQDLHGDLIVEVFKDNVIGRRFYDRYGFTFEHETIFERTGDALLRLVFTEQTQE